MCSADYNIGMFTICGSIQIGNRFSRPFKFIGSPFINIAEDNDSIPLWDRCQLFAVYTRFGTLNDLAKLQVTHSMEYNLDTKSKFIIWFLRFL